MQRMQYTGYLHLVQAQGHNNDLCTYLTELDHQSIQLSKLVLDSAATAAPHSSGGTPG